MDKDEKRLKEIEIRNSIKRDASNSTLWTFFPLVILFTLLVVIGVNQEKAIWIFGGVLVLIAACFFGRVYHRYILNKLLLEAKKQYKGVLKL